VIVGDVRDRRPNGYSIFFRNRASAARSSALERVCSGIFVPGVLTRRGQRM
jgi:hypothetical protein